MPSGICNDLIRREELKEETRERMKGNTYSKGNIPHNKGLNKDNYEPLKIVSNKTIGEKHWSFGKFGLDNPNCKNEYPYKWGEFEKKIFERDNHKCQGWFPHKCTKRLHVHHTLPRDLYPELIFEMSVCITVCNGFHTAIHHRGRKDSKEVCEKKSNGHKKFYQTQEGIDWLKDRTRKRKEFDKTPEGKEIRKLAGLKTKETCRKRKENLNTNGM